MLNSVFRLLSIVFLAMASAVGYSQALSLPPELSDVVLPAETQALAAAAQATTNRFPDADRVLVDDLVREVFRPDGTSVSVDDEYSRILTEKGRHESAMRSFFFMAAYGTVTVVRAELIKPDGRRVPIDVAANGRIMIESGQMGANIYDPNMKLFQLSLPGLEIGDVTHFIVIRQRQKAQVPDTWADLNTLEGTEPIVHFRYEVLAPATRPLTHVRLRDPVSNSVQYAAQKLVDGRTLHRWDIHDVPQMFPEPDMPPMETVVQRVLLSTAADWPSLSRWYWNLSQPRLAAVTPEMRATVSNLVAGAADRAEALHRLYTFVSQDVRYLGLTLETVAPGYEPHDVSLTFSQRAGVCRDKAALLVAMLRLAGFDAYPVLINVGAKLDPEVPLPFFNHAIVGVARPEGGYDLLDPTNESTRDPFPAYLGNRSYLVANPSGDPLRVSAVAPAERNLLRVATRGELDAGGNLSIAAQVSFDGINDTFFRSQLLRQKPDERRRFFEGLLKVRLPGAELTELRIAPANLQDTTVPLTVALSGHVRDYPVAGGGITLVNPPWLGPSLGYTRMLLDGATLEKRRYPLQTQLACGVDDTFEIKAARGVLGDPVEQPPRVEVSRAGEQFDLAIAATNGGLYGHYRHVLTQPEYTPAEYAEIKASLRDVEYASRQRPLFASTSAAQADTRVLSDDLRIELQDARTWTSTRTTVREVLTYSGKKRNSELKMPFNPVWQTAELISATVSNRDGSVRAVTPREVTLMDAPWVGGAPRYPAGRTRVISLPGVEIGSVIRFVVRRTQRNASFFCIEQPFGGADPVESASLELIAPASLPMATRVPHGGERLKASVFNEGQTVRRRWEAHGLPALAPEEDLPPWRVFQPTVLASCGNWKDYARETRRSFDELMRRQPLTRLKARELVAGVHGDRARVRAIRDFVAVNVRAAGPEFTELPLSALTPPDRTLSEGYGSQADSSLLLAAMLRAAGLDADPVLASSAPHSLGEDLSPEWETPQSGLFGHLLVQVEADDGVLYLGDQDQYAELGTTPHEQHPLLDERGRQATVKVDRRHERAIDTDWTIDLSDDGMARITIEKTYFGPACAEFRRDYAEMPPEERNRHFQELVAEVSQAAKPVGDLVTDLASYPGHERFTVEAPRYAVVDGRTLTLTLPGAAFTPVPLRADRRTNPLFVDHPSHESWSCRVFLPPGFRSLPVAPAGGAWRLPENLGWVGISTSTFASEESSEGFQRLPAGVSRAAKQPRTVLSMRRQCDIRSALIGPDYYPALLEMNRRLTHPRMATLVAVRD